MLPNYDTFIVFTGTYSTVEDAVHDFETVKALYDNLKIIDTFDAAVLEKQANGKVKIVKKHEQPTREGLKLGAGLGLATGVAIALFPGAAIGAGLLAATTGAGAAIGALAGHAAGGMSRSDLKELGETLDTGTASLVVIAASDIEGKVRDALKKAVKTIRKQVKANMKELEKELEQAAKEEAVLAKH
ncbi:MAG: hypothetical protein U0103_04425 [Candidatus Obscuribacterales bacterium]